MNKYRPSAPRIISLLGSRKFFIGVLILLGIQALWIALTGKYPMAFDEDFHLGIIRLYANHSSPFWSMHPTGGDAFGAITRDPSYLFHYLLSFPYRLIALFTSDQTMQVIILRLLNIAFFLSGLPLYRRLLRQTGASDALINVALLLFSLIPIVPLLVAQINYDNALFPLTALTLLLATRVVASLRLGDVDTTAGIQFLAVGLFASLIKYAFLPIFVAAFVVIFIGLLRTFGIKKLIPTTAMVRAIVGSRAAKLSLGALAVLLVLSFQRYGINVIRYHTPVPDCDQVLTIAQCSSYGPWIRDHDLELANMATANPVTFTSKWFQGMWLRTFFTLDGPSSNFETRGPFIVPALSAIVFAVAGLSAILLRRRALWRGNGATMTLLTAITLFYIAVLFFQQFQLYSDTGVPVAINGRYLIPIAPILIVFGALGARQFFRRASFKVAIAVVAIACMAWGGGALTYILRSNDGWYWPSGAVRTANHAVQQTIGPLTPGYTHPTAFLPYP